MSDPKGPKVLVHPPLVSVVAPAVAVVLEWLAPLSILPPMGVWHMLLAGLVLSGVAGWLAVSGERAFRSAGTNVDPREPALVLVQEGPYRFSRNPMYLGMVILQVGLALVFSLDWALIAAPVVWALLHYGVVLREEAYLSDRFGAAYSDYLSQSRRWV